MHTESHTFERIQRMDNEKSNERNANDIVIIASTREKLNCLCQKQEVADKEAGLSKNDDNTKIIILLTAKNGI